MTTAGFDSLFESRMYFSMHSEPLDTTWFSIDHPTEQKALQPEERVLGTR